MQQKQKDREIQQTVAEATVAQQIGKEEGTRGKGKQEKKAINCEVRGRAEVANGSYPLPWQSIERCRVASGIG